MNHTEIYSPHFFLVSTKDVIEIKPPCIIGRTKGEIQIKDSKLSSQHCEFSVKGIRIFIKDLDSTNGTFVNRERLNPNEEVEIQLNDQIQLGTHIYTLNLEKPKVKRVFTEESTEESVRVFSANGITSFYNASLPAKITYLIFIMFSAIGIYLDHGRMDLYTFFSMLYMTFFTFVFFLCLSYLKGKYLKTSYFFSSVVSILSLPIFFFMYVALMPSPKYHYSSNMNLAKREIKFSKAMILKYQKSIEDLATGNLKETNNFNLLHRRVTFYHENVVLKLDPVRHRDIISAVFSSYPVLSEKLKNISETLCPEEPRACELQEINQKILQKLNEKVKSIPVTTLKTNDN